jgi:hypothetical protein
MMRCPATWFVLRHDVIRRWKRAPDGTVITPHVLEWECLRCGKVVGVTPVVPLVAAPRPRLHALVEKGRAIPDTPARRKDG